MTERRKILAVEDNPVGALVLKRALEGMGFEVIGPFATGEEALETLSGMWACLPDAAVVDIYLAGAMDGLEVARRLYDEFGVPAILASEARHDDLPDQVAPCGAWSFIAKPVEPTSLGVALELALRRMAMEKRILASEARHRRLFDNTPVGLFEADLDGRLLKVNPAMARMLGYADPVEAVEQMRDLGERLFDDAAQAAAFLSELRAHGRAAPRVVGFLGKDGDFLHVEAQGAIEESVSPVETKKLACGLERRPLIEGAVQDVTARVEAEAQAASMRRLFEGTVDSIGDHVALLDLDRRAMFVNAAMRTYYGFDGVDAGEFSLPETAYCGQEPRPECPHVTALRSAGRCEVEYLDGRRDRILRIASFPFLDADGDVIGSVHLARDVTEFKRR